MKTILIVDDEFGTVEVLAAVLGDEGHRVSTALNGRAALAALNTPGAPRPDLVLLDLVMPVLDGAETLRSIRKDPALATVPVVMISGLPESMVRRRCRGYDAYLRKPFTLDELIAVVRRHLAR